MKHDIRGTISSYGATFFALLSPVKIAMLNASPYRDGLYLNRVNVPKGFRGQGVGSALMQEFLKAARTTNIKRIIVEPGGYQASDQKRRIRWYKKHGFVKYEEGYYMLDLTKPQQGTNS